MKKKKSLKAAHPLAARLRPLQSKLTSCAFCPPLFELVIYTYLSAYSALNFPDFNFIGANLLSKSFFLLGMSRGLMATGPL
jgi:hypothetical protein